MENLIIQNSRGTDPGEKLERPKRRLKTYSKIQDDVYERFDENNIRPIYRMVYMALSGCLIPNSEFSRATFKDLRRKSGVSSDETIKKALDQLAEKGFISRMGNSTYRLWHCVFKGIREEQIAYSELTEPTTPSVVTPTTPSVVPHARVLLSRLTIKEQRHGTDAVNLTPLIFGESSPFKTGIDGWQWSTWIKKFGFEWCQEMVTELEGCYQKNYSEIKSPVRLMQKALKEGAEWKLRQKREEECKNRERDHEVEKQREDMAQKVWDQEKSESVVQYELDDTDYELAIKQPYFISKAENFLRNDAPSLDESGEVFRIRLRHTLVRMYRELSHV